MAISFDLGVQKQPLIESKMGQTISKMGESLVDQAMEEQRQAALREYNEQVYNRNKTDKKESLLEQREYDKEGLLEQREYNKEQGKIEGESNFQAEQRKFAHEKEIARIKASEGSKDFSFAKEYKTLSKAYENLVDRGEKSTPEGVMLKNKLKGMEAVMSGSHLAPTMQAEENPKEQNSNSLLQNATSAANAIGNVVGAPIKKIGDLFAENKQVSSNPPPPRQTESVKPKVTKPQKDRSTQIKELKVNLSTISVMISKANTEKEKRKLGFIKSQLEQALSQLVE